MKFHFSLEALLKHRQRCEEEALRDLSVARNELQKRLSELEAYYQQIDHTHQRMQSCCEEGGDCAAELAVLNEFVKGQKVRVESKKGEIRQQKSVVEEKQSIYLVAAKEHKTIEKLKEKRYQQHLLRLKKKREKALDDLIVMRGKREVL